MANLRNEPTPHFMLLCLWVLFALTVKKFPSLEKNFPQPLVAAVVTNMRYVKRFSHPPFPNFYITWTFQYSSIPINPDMVFPPSEYAEPWPSYQWQEPPASLAADTYIRQFEQVSAFTCICAFGLFIFGNIQ